MLAFVPVILARKGSPRHRAWGRAYAIAYAALCITAFGVYSQQRFWFPHWLALAGLAVLAVGYLAVRLKPRGWRYVHLTAMLLSAYNLFGGAVNEAFLRFGALRALAGPEALSSPVVGVTHAVVMFAFLLLIGGYAARRDG
jgi:energy-coupling factor transporter transmembrane protein EcfT